MKIVDLLSAAPVLQQLINRRMPARLAYAMAKNARMINQELQDYDQTRLNLLSAHWTLDPNTNKYDVPDEDQDKWRKMHEDLIQAEADFQPYKVDFSLAENIELTPGELIAISFIFDHLDLDSPGLTASLE